MFDGNALDHRNDAALGRRIGLVARRALDGREARDPDQRTAGIARLGAIDHVPRRLAQREEHAVEIDRQRLAVGFGRHADEGRRAEADAGIGEARVDAPEFLHRRADAVDDLFLVGHVDFPRMDLHAMRAKLLGGALVLVLVGAPDRDIGARLRDGVGHAEADAAIAAGDQRDLAGKIEGFVGHGVSP